jgi:hypothetical protein
MTDLAVLVLYATEWLATGRDFKQVLCALGEKGSIYSESGAECLFWTRRLWDNNFDLHFHCKTVRHGPDYTRDEPGRHPTRALLGSCPQGKSARPHCVRNTVPEYSTSRSRVPQTCRNFAELTKKGYYNGVVFHRIIAVRRLSKLCSLCGRVVF